MFMKHPYMYMKFLGENLLSYHHATKYEFN